MYINHLRCLVSTPQYATIESVQRRREEHEIGLGDLAQCGAEERRSALRTASHFERLPEQLASCVQPQLTSLMHDLRDEHQLRLDADFYYSLPSDERERFTTPILVGESPIGTKHLRDTRLEHDRRKAAVRSSCRGGMLRWTTRESVPPPPPTAGLAPQTSSPRITGGVVSASPTLSSPTVSAVPPVTAPSAPPPVIAVDVTPVPFEPPSHVAIEIPSSTDDVVATSAFDIGSDAWKRIDENERQTSLECLLKTVSLSAMETSGIPQLVRNYLRKLAPLERLPATRGHEWRATRHAGPLAGKFSDIIQKDYEPVRLFQTRMCVYA